MNTEPVTKISEETLLQNFGEIARKVREGEVVIVETKEGDLRLRAENAGGNEILGSLSDVILGSSDDIVDPTTKPEDWNASL